MLIGKQCTSDKWLLQVNETLLSCSNKIQWNIHNSKQTVCFINLFFMHEVILIDK